MSFLTLLAIALGVITLGYIVRIFELSSELKGEQQNWVIRDKDNKTQGTLFLLFLIGFFLFVAWQLVAYKDRLLPVAASEEGVEIDWLMNFNFIIIFIVFVIVNFLLFYFAFKYRFDSNRKALYYPVNHRLEILWTVIPGIAMAIIIVLGLKLWSSLQRDPVENGEEHIKIELVAEQFRWSARYAGDDNELGNFNYRLIAGANNLGVDSTDANSWDDFTLANEIYIPKGKRVYFSLRSKDIIHSAYFPHFRMQMNCVPGLHTMLHFMPTITTDSMRMITKNENFEYILLCNKICGASHFNMKMVVKVVEMDEFTKWYDEKKKNTIFKMDAPAAMETPKMEPVADTTKKD
jgi:cytochrome c oxidase subunit II